MSDISVRAAGFSDVDREMKAAGPAVTKAVNGAAKAAAVFLTERLWENTPVDTGDMQFSTWLAEHAGEWVLGQVAPYSSFVDARSGHFSAVLYGDAVEAFRHGARVGDELLRTGAGPEAVASRFFTEGVFRDTRGRYSGRPRGWRR